MEGGDWREEERGYEACHLPSPVPARPPSHQLLPSFGLTLNLTLQRKCGFNSRLYDFSHQTPGFFTPTRSKRRPGHTHTHAHVNTRRDTHKGVPLSLLSYERRGGGPYQVTSDKIDDDSIMVKILSHAMPIGTSVGQKHPPTNPWRERSRVPCCCLLGGMKRLHKHLSYFCQPLLTQLQTTTRWEWSEKR